jgi:hypothetical protein
LSETAMRETAAWSRLVYERKTSKDIGDAIDQDE